jgi:hypothetical protein
VLYGILLELQTDKLLDMDSNSPDLYGIVRKFRNFKRERDTHKRESKLIYLLPPSRVNPTRHRPPLPETRSHGMMGTRITTPRIFL